jgi:antitoxin component YwqK of YwqJK toxin-antitoxin module
LPVLPAPVERPTSLAGPQRVVENYDSGQERSESYVLGDGTKIGVWTVWHENGQKWMEYEYRNGLMDGPFLKWYPNGQKRTVGEYRGGKKEGAWTAWYEAGGLDGVEVSGLMWEGTHRADKKDGPWTFWSVDGSINGELSGIYRNDEKTVERP